MVGKWPALKCDYFTDEALAIMGEYMKQHGFRQHAVSGWGAVSFMAGDTFVEVNYDLGPTLGTDYGPHAAVGHRYDVRDEGRTYACVPLWYVIPDGHPAKEHYRWRFESQGELHRVLIRFRSDVIDAFARPLWEDEQLLRSWYARFKSHLRDERARKTSRRPRLP